MKFIIFLMSLALYTKAVSAEQVIFGYKNYLFGDDIAKFECAKKSPFHDMFKNAGFISHSPDFFEGYITPDELVTKAGKLLYKQAETCTSIKQEDLIINGAVVSVVYGFYRNKLLKISVYIDTKDFSNVLGVLEARYGKPEKPHGNNYYLWRDSQGNSIEFKGFSKITFNSTMLKQLKTDYESYVKDEL